MIPLLSLVQIILRPSGDDLFLMPDVVYQDIFEVHHLWLVIYQCQHNYAKAILQLCMFVELI